MTSEEFWKDDPKLFSSYQKSYIEKKKREYETINMSSWLQGLYIYDGLEKSLKDFGYGFIAGKQNPNREIYPQEPYDLFKNKETKDLDKIKEREKVRKENQKNLNFWARIKK